MPISKQDNDHAESLDKWKSGELVLETFELKVKELPILKRLLRIVRQFSRVGHAESNVRKINEAVDFCISSHALAPGGPQLRKYTLQPYPVHPLRVAYAYAKVIKREMESLEAGMSYLKSCDESKVPEHMIDRMERLNLELVFGVQVALLHDVLEDCENVSKSDIEGMFGDTVANGVDELTDKFTSVEMNRKERKRLETERLCLIEDYLRLIKIMDLRDNYMDIHLHDDKFAATMCSETHEFVEHAAMSHWITLAKQAQDLQALRQQLLVV